MDVLGDVVARDRPSEIALRRASRAGSYSYAKLRTNAWKAGNLLRHYGVRPGTHVDVVRPAAGPTPPVATGFFGATLVGASVDPSPPRTVDGTALLAPATHVEDFDAAPGCSVLAYGDVPDDPAVSHYERELWSENSTAPPGNVDPDATALRTDGEAYSHAALLSRARDVAETRGFEPGAEVRAGTWNDPTSLIETLLAPLVAGATIRLDDEERP
ncbi:MAG: hypothetical protein ABEI96_08445 [Haloarculaceae archaeon]